MTPEGDGNAKGIHGDIRNAYDCRQGVRSTKEKRNLIVVKNYYRRLFSIVAAIAVMLTTILAPVCVVATENIDMSKSGKASLILQLPAANDSVKLYQIAEYDSESTIKMKEEAEDLNVTIDSKDSEAALSEKAKTLAAGISGKPTVGKTDATGGVIFDKLALGYYLVVVDNCESSSMKYQIAPAIVSVPVAEGSA